MLVVLLILIMIVIVYNTFNTFNKKTTEHFPYVFWTHRRPALRRVDRYHYGVPLPLYPHYYTNRYFHSPPFYMDPYFLY